jgi:hypothetical protein
MENPNHSVHHTTVHKITNGDIGGWEFHCVHCDFHMRYFLPESSTGARVEIFSLGDISAQHMNNIACLEVKQLELFEQEWLTPEIRLTIDQILKRFDD